MSNQEHKSCTCTKCQHKDCKTKGEPIVSTCSVKNCENCKKLRAENERKFQEYNVIDEQQVSVEARVSDDFLHVKKPMCKELKPRVVCGSGNRPGSKGGIVIIEDYFSKPSTSSDDGIVIIEDHFSKPSSNPKKAASSVDDFEMIGEEKGIDEDRASDDSEYVIVKPGKSEDVENAKSQVASGSGSVTRKEEAASSCHDFEIIGAEEESRKDRGPDVSEYVFVKQDKSEHVENAKSQAACGSASGARKKDGIPIVDHSDSSPSSPESDGFELID